MEGAAPLDVVLDRHLGERFGDGVRTLRYLAGLRAFTPRDSDVWIGSYPRSGTTWLQYVTYLLCHPQAEAGDDDAPPFAHVGDVVPWLERGLSRGLLSPAPLEALAPPRLFKTHLPAAWVPQRGRVLYAVRAAPDVLVSYFHLYRSHLGYQGSLAAFAEQFLDGEVQYGSWWKHTAGWRARAAGDRRVLVVRYEALLADARALIGRVARFLEVDASDARLDDVARWTRFSAMRAHEERFDHVVAGGPGPRAGTGFIRAGRRDAGATLDATLRARLQAARAPRLAALELRLGRFLR